MVDPQGVLLGVKVLPAKITDREGSQQLLQELRQNQPQMKLHLFADGGDHRQMGGLGQNDPRRHRRDLLSAPMPIPGGIGSQRGRN
ncbi:hypothetical protein [Deinococcus sp. QL22]|uniref:hypothetical protein n=1 Tax=Deinococcus sp. QL22 TaxID=2939437 RepID=UPI0035303875